MREVSETTLKDVQTEVIRQIIRDYSGFDTTLLSAVFSLGIAEEAGEVAGLFKRFFRRDKIRKDEERFNRENLIEELGDVLWYLTAICSTHDITLEEVWNHNVAKLEERYGR